MVIIQSVLGPVDTEELGFTLMHEHVLSSSAGVWYTYPELVNRRWLTESVIADLREAAAEGLQTFVDVTPFDLGRDIQLLQDAAEGSGVHIIAATGTHRNVPRAFLDGTTVDLIAELYIREIQEGIEGTGIKAGIIKVANDQEGVDAPGALMLRAAARAHLRTGVPISTHSYAPGRVGEAQLAILQEEGVYPGRVYIGHCNDTEDMDYLTGLCRKGCYLGMDRFPGGGALGWEQRVQVVKGLIDAGFASQVMLSHDRRLCGPNTRMGRMERRGNNPDGINFIVRKVLPRLREMGVSEETIHLMMVESPRRYFEGR
ncbi:MAG: phosphotriesterase-related protein [Chloroflexi bacterium]|nr:phosphotriesterase-related protein [Chloroflexota bacterium]